MNNPWLNISWNDTIAACDKNHPVVIGSGKNKKTVPFGSKEYVDFINQNDDDNVKNGKKRVALRFDCFPEPFYGDPNSKVYCLNMNPGEPDPDFNESNDRNGGLLYQASCQAMLEHNLRNSEKKLIFNGSSIESNAKKYETAMKSIMKNLKDFKNNHSKYCPRPHLGDVWQGNVWKQLKENVGHEPKMFIVEFFPYHSTSGFPFPADLPSYAYRNHLIDQAIKNNKLIIIMRKEQEWYKIQDCQLGDVGLRLKNYSNKIFLKNSRRVWLSPGNFVIPAHLTMNDVINSFK